MTLCLIKAGQWETPNYAITSAGHRYFPAPVYKDRQVWHVQARTDIGQRIYPDRSPELQWAAAQMLVERLERCVMVDPAYPPLPDAPHTAADLIAYREYLYPGLCQRDGHRAIATVLWCTYVHVRQMEDGAKPITARNSHALRAYAVRYMTRLRADARAANLALEPFALLHDALMTDDPGDQDADNRLTR